MRVLALLGIAAGVFFGTGSLTTPATAGTAAYLLRTGSGSACTKAQPCTSMLTAVGVAGAGGEVICLDKGDYGNPAIIGFTITISCGDGLWESAGAAIQINPPAGADVVIEGLVSDRLAFGGPNLYFNGQGALHLRRVRIGNATNLGPTHAVHFQPSGPAKLFVTDSDFYNTGTSGIAAGILIQPDSGVTAQVTIERSRFENNRFGIIADGTSNGIIRGVVRDSVIAGNVSNGITVSTNSSSVVLSVDRCAISGNSFGLAAGGSGAGMLVGGSVITANNTGLFTTSGAVLLSYGDNRVNANTSDGAFTGAVGLK
jgi:Periplasmic copper-binding protein (NosD)